MRRILFLAALVALVPSTAAQSFQRLGFGLPNATTSVPTGLSDNGNVVIGTNGAAFAWARSTGFRYLPNAAGGSFSSYVRGVNGDGTMAVGWTDAGSGDIRPAVWSLVDTLYVHGGLPGIGASSRGVQAYGLSSDGTIAAGTATGDFDPTTPELESRAVRWVNGEIQTLGSLGFPTETAQAISRDGSTTVGTVSGSGTPGLAARWGADGAQVLGTLPGGTVSQATAVDGTGATVVGWGNSTAAREAFRWDADSGMVALGFPDGYSLSTALAVSADGSVVGGQLNNFFAAVWTEERGWRLLSTMLEEAGLGDQIQGFRFVTVSAISADGRTFVGAGLNEANQTEGFIAFIPDGITIVVTVPSDEPNDPVSQADGVCDVDRSAVGDQCTLRAAIQLANLREGATIEFDIPGDPYIYRRVEEWPVIERTTTLDGTTQEGGYVLVSGSENYLQGRSGDSSGIVIGPRARESVVRGLVVNGFGAAGIRIEEGADDCLIEDNRIGTNFAGTQAAGGGGASCHLFSTSAPGRINCLDGGYGAGLHIQSSNNRVIDNVIAGNTWFLDGGTTYGGVQVLIDVNARGNRLERNRIGYGADGRLILTPVQQDGGYDDWNDRVCNDIYCWFPIGVSVFGSGNVIGGSPEAANQIGGFAEDVWVHGSSNEIHPQFRVADGVVPSGNVVSHNGIGTAAPVLVAKRFDGGILLNGQGNSASRNTLTTTRRAIALLGPNAATENAITGWTAPSPSRDVFSVLQEREGAVVIIGTGAMAQDNVITSGAWGVVLSSFGADARVLGNEVDAVLGGLLVPTLFLPEGDGPTQFQGSLILDNTFHVPGGGGIGMAFADGRDIRAQGNTVETDGTGVLIPMNTFLEEPQRVLLTENRISAPAGIDLGAEGVTLNDVSDADDGPNALVNYPVLVQAVRDGETYRWTGRLEGGDSGETYTVEVFANERCASRMTLRGYRYGAGEAFVGSVGVTPSLLDLGDTPFEFTSGSLAQPPNYLSLTSSRHDLFVTSEFGPCIQLAAAIDAARVAVEAGRTGPVLTAVDTVVSVDEAPARGGSGAAPAGHGPGTVYATRYTTAPAEGPFASAAAASPSGAAITPEAVAERYWLLGETGLTAVASGEAPPTFGVCVHPSEAVLEAERDRVVIVVRSEATGGLWVPVDTERAVIEGVDHHCASGIAELGEVGLGGAASAFPVARDDSPAEGPGSATLAVRVFPNPAHHGATVAVSMPAPGEARASVHDALGRTVAVLYDGAMAAGTHALALDTHGLAPGVYVVRVVTGAGASAPRLTVVH